MSDPYSSATPDRDLLARSLSTAALDDGWRRVERNQGCAGFDRQEIFEFAAEHAQHLLELKSDVESGRYRPSPLRGVRIPKRSGGTRLLAIPSVRDRVLQTSVACALTDVLDPRLSDCSFAYRPGRSASMAVDSVIRHRDAGLVHVVDADIESFFDQIDHAILRHRLASELPGQEATLKLIDVWLAADLRDPADSSPRLLLKGVPQGSPLSPLFADLYLDPLDRTLLQANLALVRYADDLVILCKQEGEARAAMTTLRGALSDLRLSLHSAKSRVSSFDAGFQFLGMRFIQRIVEPMPKATRWRPAPVGAPTRETPPARRLRSLDISSTDDELTADGAQASALLNSLYVDQLGVCITKEHDRAVVSLKERILVSVPLGRIDQIAVLDNALISTALLRECASRKISVVFAGPGGEVIALQRGDLPSQRVVQTQWQAQSHNELQFMFARQFLEGKVHNARTVLRRFSRRDGRAALAEPLRVMDDCQHRLGSASTVNALRGLEGTAARAYFSGLRTLLPPGIEFCARRRRPPPDPVNALLSLGYTVLENNMHTLVRLEGLNAHLGHLHQCAPRSLALVSDLIEEFRAPVVDATMLTLIRQGAIGAGDFEIDTAPDSGVPCRIKPAARRTFVEALESRMNSVQLHPRLDRSMDLRRSMQFQVKHYYRVLLREEPVYQPFKLR